MITGIGPLTWQDEPARSPSGGFVSARRSAHLLALPLVALVALAGCGGSSGGKQSVSTQNSPRASASVDSAAAALLPASVKSKGGLTVAADATYAPNEFIGPDGHTVVGMDADLAAALGGVLGVKVTMQNQTFDSIIPGIVDGKYDLGMSSFTDNKKREQQVDFVDYFVAGTSFFIKANTATKVNSLADLCGLSVSVEKGTTQQDDATAQSSKCTKAGKKKVSVQVFPDQNGANLALSSGRVQVSMADSPVAAYQVKKSNGQFALSGQPYGTAPYGIACTKGTGLDKAIEAALQDLISNGTYMQILNKWGIQSGAITTPTINGATS
jgi:polar amino acid transport system substrate-binding protein